MNIYLSDSQKRAQLLRWAGTIGTLILLVILVQKQGWGDVRNAFQQVSLERFLVCLGLIMISRFAVAGRWYSLLRFISNISFYQSIRLTFAGLFATNFLPTTVGGDVVRLAGANKLKVDMAAAAASLIVDRLVGLFGMAMVLPFGAKPLMVWLSSSKALQVNAHWSGVLPWVTKLWAKGVDLLHRIYRAVLLWSKYPNSLLLSLGLTFIHMLCFFGTITLLLGGMGEHLSIGMVGGLWSFVYFVTLIPISINGYGVQEISMAFIFTEVGGISLESGLAISVLFRTLLMLGSVPGVIFLPGIIAGASPQNGTERKNS